MTRSLRPSLRLAASAFTLVLTGLSAPRSAEAQSAASASPYAPPATGGTGVAQSGSFGPGGTGSPPAAASSAGGASSTGGSGGQWGSGPGYGAGYGAGYGFGGSTYYAPTYPPAVESGPDEVAPAAPRSPAMIAVGFTFVGLGAAGVLTGVMTLALTPDPDLSQYCGADPSCGASARSELSTLKTAGTAALVGGGALFLIGLPMGIYGASGDEPSSPAPGPASSTRVRVGVGPLSGHVDVAF